MSEDIDLALADLIERRFRALGRPCLVGLSGAQGSGKSTSAGAVRALLTKRGLKAAVLSLDDFYLTRAERSALASRAHPLLATRGPPGTHDVALGLTTIDALLGGMPVSLPSFDKTIDDRRSSAEWETVAGPVDIVILEGWCVSARPQSDTELAVPVNALEAEQDPDGAWRRFVNEALRRYQALFAKIDFLILFAAPSFEIVSAWRYEQEQTLSAKAGDRLPADHKLMTKAQIDRFIQLFERITRAMLAETPGRADVVVELDEARRCKGLIVR